MSRILLVTYSYIKILKEGLDESLFHMVIFAKKDICDSLNEQIKYSHVECIPEDETRSVYLLQKAKQLYPDYDYYCWKDFSDYGYIDLFKLRKIKNKIICRARMPPPTSKVSASNMKLIKPIIWADHFIVPNEMLDNLHAEYVKIEQEWQNNNFKDNENNLFYQIYVNNKNKFHLEINENLSLLELFNVKLNLDTRLDIILLLKFLDLRGDFIEIGVFQGEFSEHLLRSDTRKLYLVDPYKNFDILEYTDAINNHNMEENYQKALARVAKYPDRYEFIKKTSDEALELFADNSIDFVYIDGNHAYQYVLNDLENYWKKVKKGGILMGDDYYDGKDKDVRKYWDGVEDINKSKSFGIYGVKAAVSDFAKKYKLLPYLYSHQFIFIKL